MYQNEFSQEFEQAIGQEMEQGYSGETFEFNPEYLGEASAQGESYEAHGELEGELNETYEMELAHQALEISNELELNQFLGGLLKKVGGAVSGFAKSPVGRGVFGALKSVGKQVLPMAAGALGTAVGGPLGGLVGGKLGALASNLFELELEGLSPEDQEFETARAYVRFANSAAQRAAALQRQGPPAAVVRKALAGAAMQHAPGLLRPRNADGTFRSTRSAGSGRRPGAHPQAIGFGGGYPAATSYAALGPGDDSAGYQPDEPGSYAPQPRPHRATSGTWHRRGRTLIIQL